MTASTTYGLTKCEVFPLEPERLEEFVPEAAEWRALVASTARVRSPCKSDPAPGSDMPMAPINSPLAMRGRKRRFCSSVP